MDLYPSDTIFIMKGFKKMAKLLLINISDPKSISRRVSPMNVVMFPIKNLTKFFLSCVRQRFPSIIRLCLQIQVQNGV